MRVTVAGDPDRSFPDVDDAHSASSAARCLCAGSCREPRLPCTAASASVVRGAAYWTGWSARKIILISAAAQLNEQAGTADGGWVRRGGRWGAAPDGRTAREWTKEARLCAGGRRGTSGRSGQGTWGRGAEGGEGVGHDQRTRHELVQ